MKCIARIYTDFNEKFGIPRQSRLIKETLGKIVFEKEYRDINSIRGLDEFSHIWLLWEFSETKREKWSPTVRPPLLGGNKKVGVFATRSPFRPNPIGLSCVELKKIEITKKDGPVIYVLGADILNNTPIFDIKPYLSYADSIPDAKCGFTKDLSERSLEVIVEEELLNKIEKEKQEEIIAVLKGDPRPSYQEDSERIYGMGYGKYEIKFKVDKNILKIIEIN